MAFELPDLPYSLDALAPNISAETLEYHHGKHHQAYVTTLNKLVEGTDYANMSLEDVIRKSSGTLFNQAGQVWNHTMYWNCMSPNGGGEPEGKLGELIQRDFGDFNRFVDTFSKACISQFGSGWGWLVQKDDGKLEVVSTSNAENPLTEGLTPLLVCDVWEHAYYIDYRNARPKYVDSFFELVNWDYVASQLKS
ncbi:MAG TPA: Fe-Mn family superoxide dismutase [Wenzhouxiangella sp.]|nr:Fe-Mn family superoxide dismutase [Wenzhouxiangella sp.]HLS04669.1 Fe-Mn family superoxide dismutase [Wenzhouxiangella sp.]